MSHDTEWRVDVDGQGVRWTVHGGNVIYALVGHLRHRVAAFCGDSHAEAERAVAGHVKAGMRGESTATSYCFHVGILAPNLPWWALPRAEDMLHDKVQDHPIVRTVYTCRDGVVLRFLDAHEYSNHASSLFSPGHDGTVRCATMEDAWHVAEVSWRDLQLYNAIVAADLPADLSHR